MPDLPHSLPAPCVIMSDAHIGAARREVELEVLRFLDALPDDAASLVVNGDLVDFWFEWRHVVPRAGYRVVAALATLVRRGIPVLWVGGNHDCWGADIVREAGIHFTEDPWRGRLAEWSAYVAHGDGLRGAEDRGYRILRRVLRNRWAIRAFRLLHPDWGTALARGSAHASRSYRAPDEGTGLRNVAWRMLAGDPTLELVVFGHSHVAALEPATDPRQVYANAGEWLNNPTYLRLTPEVIELRRWTGNRGATVQEYARVPAVRT